MSQLSGLVSPSTTALRDWSNCNQYSLSEVSGLMMMVMMVIMIVVAMMMMRMVVVIMIVVAMMMMVVVVMIIMMVMLIMRKECLVMQHWKNLNHLSKSLLQ